MATNVWLAVREDAFTEVKEAVEWDAATKGRAYDGAVRERTTRLMTNIAGSFESQADLFMTVQLDGANWKVYNLIVEGDIDAVKAEVNYTTSREARTIVLGAWDYDTGNVVGYPLHPRILEFCPDVVVGTDKEGQPAVERPTDLAGANILFGQAKRRM
jgi:hypothetical protein